MQKLLHIPVRRNAAIEVNNLLAHAEHVEDVTAGQVQSVLDKYKTNVMGLSHDARLQLYRQYEAHTLKDDDVYPEEKQDLKYLQGLLGLSDEQAAHVHVEIAGRIFQDNVDRTIRYWKN